LSVQTGRRSPGFLNGKMSRRVQTGELTQSRKGAKRNTQRIQIR
jgi:hypothetical protein